MFKATVVSPQMPFLRVSCPPTISTWCSLSDSLVLWAVQVKLWGDQWCWVITPQWVRDNSQHRDRTIPAVGEGKERSLLTQPFLPSNSTTQRWLLCFPHSKTYCKFINSQEYRNRCRNYKTLNKCVCHACTGPRVSSPCRSNFRVCATEQSVPFSFRCRLLLFFPKIF